MSRQSSQAFLAANGRNTRVDVPAIGEPEHLGELVGPHVPLANDLEFYGTDLGITFTHKGEHIILFGDTWADATTVCAEGSPNDDVMGTLPMKWEPGVMPRVSLVPDPAQPAHLKRLHIYRGSESLPLGLGQAPLAGFSDGEDAFVVFERLEPVRCTEAQIAAGGPCLPGTDSFCSQGLGTCEPRSSFPAMCNAALPEGCAPGVQCVEASYCIDRTSSQFDDGHVSGQAAAIAHYTDIGVARRGEPATFDSVVTWHTNKFSHPATQTVQRFSYRTDGSDYNPGHDTLLYWGRPGFIAEQGRQAQVYLMAHALPVERKADGQWDFKPKFFAGVDPRTHEPQWSSVEAEAKSLALDGEVGGSPSEELGLVGIYGVTWLPAPVNKWIMTYGGDFADYLMSNTIETRSIRAPGAIMARFADHPWGPWSPPEPLLRPGHGADVGTPYGPGGILYSPDCVDTELAHCAPSDPHRPLDSFLAGCPRTLPDPGRLYSPYVLDEYTQPNAEGGLDMVWDVSTWNPYAVHLIRTKIGGPTRKAPSDELATRAGLRSMTSWRALPGLRLDGDRFVEQNSRERDAGPSRSLAGDGHRGFNNFVCRGANTNIATGRRSPLAFEQEECPEPYVKGAVLGRFGGAGRLVRTFIGKRARATSYAVSGDEVLRIYVDDNPVPRIDVPLSAAIDGSAGETFAPPFGAGAGRHLAWYYPVEFEHKLVVAIDNLEAADDYAYQLDAMLEQENTLLGELLDRERLPERDDVQRQMSDIYHPSGLAPLLYSPISVQLDAGSSQVVALDGPATIQELRLRVRESDLPRLQQVMLNVHWEALPQAAITLPLAELFASSSAAPEATTLALTSVLDLGDRVLSLKLPMPFLQAAVIRLENTGIMPIAFELRLLGTTDLPQDTFGHLHVQRHESVAPLQDTGHVALDTIGPGRLVGLCGFAQGRSDTLGLVQHDALNLLDADVQAEIDGRPVLLATGVDQYLDDADHFGTAPYASAFSQVWGVQNPPGIGTGRASFCRWHVLGNELDYLASLGVSIDLATAGNPATVERLSTVAFYYALIH